MMFIDRKIPSVMISHSDYTHHTTYDSPDKVDPTELERSEMIAASSLWYLANLDVAQGIDLIEYHRSNAYKRLGEMARKVRAHINRASIPELPRAWAEAQNMAQYAIQLEIEIANSILPFNSSIEIFNPVSQTRSHFGKRFEHLIVLTREVTESDGYAADGPPPLSEKPDGRIPARLTRGPLDFSLPASKLPAKEAEWYNSKDFPLNGTERFEIVNQINGKQSVAQIYEILMADYPSLADTVVSRYIEDLVKVGVVEWETPKK